MRKLLFWGDEGSGKSTLSAMLARYAVAGGAAVLVVNAGGGPAMDCLLGVPRPRMTLVEDMGGAAYVRRSYLCDHGGSLIPDLLVDTLPATCMSRRDNLALLLLGVNSLAEVGSKPLGRLFREFLGSLDDTGWWVFIDGGNWLRESGALLLDVVDGVVDVRDPEGRGETVGRKEVRRLFAGHGLPLIPVVNRGLAPGTAGTVPDGAVPRVAFPRLDTALTLPPNGSGIPFPQDFLIPLRSLWDVLMGDFGMAPVPRPGFTDGSARLS